MEINKVTYTDVLSNIGNFVSLDISIRSTGWVRYVDGVLTCGFKTLQSTDDTERRQEFRRFLKRIFGDETFEYVMVEDVYGGNNFKTVKGLLQLNSLVDDLIADDLIKVKSLIRLDNGTWKRHLRELCNYSAKITKERDKMMIQDCLHNIDFNKEVIDKYCDESVPEKSYQDIYDAMGLACAVVKKNIIDVKYNIKSTTKLKSDIRKYKITQFNDKMNAEFFASKKKKKAFVEYSDLVGKARNVSYWFKQLVEEYGDDGIFILRVETNKIGILAVEKGLNLDSDISYLVCHR